MSQSKASIKQNTNQNSFVEIIFNDQTYFVRTKLGIVFPQPLGPQYASEIDTYVYILNIANQLFSEIKFFEATKSEFDPHQIQELNKIESGKKVNTKGIQSTNFYAKICLNEGQQSPNVDKLYKQKTQVIDKLAEFIKGKIAKELVSDSDSLYEETVALCERLDQIKI